MADFQVYDSDAGQRLDVFIAAVLPHCSRRSAQAAIDAGKVRVNGRRSRKGVLLRNGDRVSVSDDVAVPAALQGNPALSLVELYCDAALVAIDKPAGIACHALCATETDTVANFLLAKFPEMRDVGGSGLEAGLVHRLDTDTTGVLLAARTAAAYAHLRDQFRKQSVIKEYLALVHGDVAAPGEVRLGLVTEARDPRRMRVLDAAGDKRQQTAVTHFAPRERFGDATLLTVRIPTGRRHQIRAHLACIGHALVGDELYAPRARQAVRDLPAAQRHLLHAARVTLQHPTGAEPFSIAAPLPADMETYLMSLREQRRR